MAAGGGRRGGRPRVVTVEEIVRAGREVGLADLTVAAVAARLGVSPAALYRHVAGRWELERLVGESVLGGLDLVEDPADGLERHLLGFAWQLRSYTVAHPGLASYLQALFPRGESGHRLLATEVAALRRRGYAADAAMVLAGAVATLAIAQAAAEEREAAAFGRPGYAEQRRDAVDRIAADPDLGAAHTGLPQVSFGEFSRLLLTASIRGLLAAAPPGRPVAGIVAALTSDAESDLGGPQ
ncbi:TetR/AcrR family transcriptional regulator [Actinomadura atramentaria]|uniref:TetR/AcrR family transcriptional regulator n=1 Tax=Actinomadura atramentaria TaxID=1990 RepID=UPI0003680C27|nr:TetR family transcriptional regulator [Actinomadura atramentaria]